MRDLLLCKFTFVLCDCQCTWYFNWHKLKKKSWHKTVLQLICSLLFNVELFLTYIATCECGLHLPFLGIMKFFFFLFLHSLVCLVIAPLLEIWVISGFSLIQIAPE